jgi:dihydropteroate synthase
MMKSMKIGTKEFIFSKRTYVMGILNVTPDSFSDGGNYNNLEDSVLQAKRLIAEGADIIDVGGESTRPGYIQITDEEEINRVVPIIKAIKEQCDIPISIDTYKSKVAEAAILAGADLVNDIWGLKYDPEMALVIKKYDVAVCLMHNREDKNYTDFRKDVLSDLNESLQIAYKHEISKDKIIIDPGVGFAKTREMNLEVIRHLEDFMSFDMPILLGTSRKSVIGLTLDLPVTEREEGTIATSVLAVTKGCHFVRVHNVLGNVRAIRMTEAILYEDKEGTNG